MELRGSVLESSLIYCFITYDQLNLLLLYTLGKDNKVAALVSDLQCIHGVVVVMDIESFFISSCQ